jgi:hypothetical protein
MTTIYINSVVINNIHHINISGNTANNIVGMQINDFIIGKCEFVDSDFDGYGRGNDNIIESIQDARVFELQKRLETSEKELADLRKCQ